MSHLSFQMKNKRQNSLMVKNRKGMGSEELIQILLYIGGAIAIGAGLFYLIKRYMP